MRLLIFLIKKVMYKMTKSLVLFFCLCMVGFPLIELQAAEEQGRWNGYYSYKKCFDIVESEEFIVGATPLGLILFHKETASYSVKNQINGLSDSGISAVGYADNDNIILVGYNNGNIDLIKNGTVFNIPDLKIESMLGSKQINHFYHHKDVVYCSTDFGILEIDIEKNEIASTFIIGEDATSLRVYNTTSHNGFLYAATSAGVLRGALENSILAYYENWELFSSSESVYCAVASADEGILAARGDIGGDCDLELITDGGTTIIDGYSSLQGLEVFHDYALVITKDKIFIYENLSTKPEVVNSVDLGDEDNYSPGYRSALLTKDETLWFTDWKGGMFYEKNDGYFGQVLPSGPLSNSVFSVDKAGEDLWVVPGGFASLLNNAVIPASASVLTDGKWLHFDKSNISEFNKRYALDLINIKVNPFNPDNVFVASWGNGLFEFDKDADGQIFLKNHFVEKNSGLQNVPNHTEDRFTRTWGLAFDQNGILYITNSEVESGIVVYDTREGSWYQYDYGSIAFNFNKIGEILIDNTGNKWLYVARGSAAGVFVFDDNGTLDNQSDDRYRSALAPNEDNDTRNAGLLRLWDENGELLTGDVLCLAKDHNGYIWFGTDVGVVVQYNPGNVFDISKPVFSRIKVPRNDGSGLADFLLEDQKVTAIAVDGANRKYVGTEGSGVYIISEDGLKTVNQFTLSNSPLPSNNIIDIHIDNLSGEVFIATERGLISYKGDAIKGGEVFSEVYAFPNPVRPGYEGPVTITGLVDRTNVKITDSAGNLVYETISLGGNALWNGRNLRGEKVNPGIYVVFLTSPDGTQSEFTKIAIVR